MFLKKTLALLSRKPGLGSMADVQQLATLRPLGKLEQVSAACHHLEFFNNVGLTAHYKLSGSSSPGVDLRRVIFAAAGDVIRKHRILSAIPVNEDKPDSYFASLPSVDLKRSISFVQRSQPVDEGEDKQLDAILEDQHNTNFKAEYGSLPFWRLVILQTPGADNEFTASFIYHHAIGDGVSGLVFHNAFRSALNAASSSLPGKNEESIVPDENTSVLPPLEELHPLPLNPTPPGPPATKLKEWTGNSIRTPCKSRWTSLCLSPRTAQAFFQECKENNLSVTSALSSIIATTLFIILPPTIEALTCIIPVNLRPWLSLPREVANGAIGTYFDATRVQFTRRDQNSQGSTVWPGAQQVSKSMTDYLANVSPSGEPYTAIAVLKTLPDVSVIFSSAVGNPRDAAFEVTNIGLFSSSTPKTEDAPLWQVGKVLLSRSSVVSGAAVTVSVATGGDGSMAVGFSWQEGVLEDGVMENVSEGVRNYFEKYQ
ncbi:Alcohol acetyltransferase [Neonectria punicea]|uniref:Alcohol acetyltransferase n=1 Tax=Neonectria punicea TaxID=979145 RepID=A0ABR1HC14_9HYPO